MNDREYQKERRRQRRIEQFPPDAGCEICGENDHRCFEWHHVTSEGFGQDRVVVCRNCHRKLSDMQKDHPPALAGAPTRTECEGRKLLGIADLMELNHSPAVMVELIRQTGLDLIERGQLFKQCDEEDTP